MTFGKTRIYKHESNQLNLRSERETMDKDANLHVWLLACVYSKVLLQVTLGGELLAALGTLECVTIVNAAMRLEPVKRIEAFRADVAFVRTLLGVNTFVQFQLVRCEKGFVTFIVHTHERQLAAVYLGVRSQVASSGVAAQTAVEIAIELLFAAFRVHSCNAISMDRPNTTNRSLNEVNSSSFVKEHLRHEIFDYLSRKKRKEPLNNVRVLYVN